MLQQQLQQPQQPQQPPPSPQQQCILFYKYFVLSISTAQRAALAEEQRALCEACGLRGRLRVACEGLNGTLAGNHEDTTAYIDAMGRDARHRFAGIDWKSADGVEAAECFGVALLSLEPSASVACYAGRGYCRALLGQLAGALADCSRAIQLDPGCAEAYVMLLAPLLATCALQV